MHRRSLSILLVLAAIGLMPGSSDAGNVVRHRGAKVKLKDAAKAAMSPRERGALYRSARADLVKAEKYRQKAMGKGSKNAAYEASMSQALRYRASVKAYRAQGNNHEADRLEGFARQAVEAALAARHDPMTRGGEALFRHEAGSWGKSPDTHIQDGELKIHGSGIGWKAEWIRKKVYKRGSKRDPHPKNRRSMVRERPLPWYREAIGPSAFNEALRDLGPKSTWLDAGAGEGRALANYLALNEKLGLSPRGSARVIAVDLEGDAAKFARQFHPRGKGGLRKGDYKVLEGDIVKVAIDRQVDLLTDYFGPLSQNAHTPDVILRRYGELLKPGGRLMIVIPAEGWNTVISNNGTRSMDLMDLIRQTKGFQAERPFAITDPNGGAANSLVLVRTADPVAVPKLQMVENSDKGTPQRVLRILRGSRGFRFTDRD